MRRAEALHPATLLIDQDRRIALAEFPAQFANKPSDLRRRLDIPFEQDEAPGPLRADELTLGGAQLRSGYARDESPRGHPGRLARCQPGGQGNGR
jgi:hypothetical protein